MIFGSVVLSQWAEFRTSCKLLSTSCQKLSLLILRVPLIFLTCHLHWGTMSKQRVSYPKETYHHRDASTQHGCNRNRNCFTSGELLRNSLCQLINCCVHCLGPERRHMLLAGVLYARTFDRFHKLTRDLKTTEKKGGCSHTSLLMIERDCVKTSAINFCTTPIAAWSCSVPTTKLLPWYRDSKAWQQCRINNQCHQNNGLLGHCSCPSLPGTARCCWSKA
jgi:hypothetical protein